VFVGLVVVYVDYVDVVMCLSLGLFIVGCVVMLLVELDELWLV